MTAKNMSNPQPLILDSSVMVKWLNQAGEANLLQADQILKDVQNGKVILSAPELAKYEIGNAIKNKQMNSSEALESLATYYQLPISFVPLTEELAKETYKCAQFSGVTYYDATFLVLARQEDCPLITDNPKHQKVEGFNVISLSDYKGFD